MNGLGKLCSVGTRKPTQTYFFSWYMKLPLQETDDTREVLSTWRPISTGMPSYFKIMADALRAALNNLLKEVDIYVLKEW